MVRNLGISLAIAAASTAWGAPSTVDLVALEASACDAFGQPVSPALGDSFHTKLRFRVVGLLAKTYTVRIESPYRKMETPALTFGQGAAGEYEVIWGPMQALTDVPVVIKATLVPQRGLREISTRNNSASYILAPRLPETAIEYYGRRSLHGSLRLNLQWNADPGLVDVWLPNPRTETFQQVLANSVPAPFQSENAAPLRATLAPESGFALSVEQWVDSLASNQRTNRSMLRSSSFADYAAELPSLEPWLRPEPLLQSQAGEIVTFAARARTRAAFDTPFDVAESIYMSVLQRMSYGYRPGDSPSALSALRRKRGDCGAMSALFAAACRSQGIPARPVAGFVMGESAWHVWAEFYVPSFGWVACDPAYAEGAMPSGKLPLYFGVMPDLNSRFATAFGFQQFSGSESVNFLQSPSAFWPNGSARATTALCTTRLWAD